MSVLKNFLIVIFIVTHAAGSYCQPRSEKRGLAYGHHSKKDLEAISTGISWWYNWSYRPEGGVLNSYTDYDVDFVPMAWNGAFDKQGMHDFLSSHPGVKYILGWNEPNFVEQANMKPSEAAVKWNDIEELADAFNLKIVSPAVNYCGNCVTENGTTYTDPVKYLDDFFSACNGCRVDYIAVHAYMGDVTALKWYLGLFKKYGKPLWLTEFANWENNPTLLDQKNFLIDAVEYLEDDEDVFRYAWFTGRHTGPPYIGLLAESGVLTELGAIYSNMPVHDPQNYITVPARIEAEAYSMMNGIRLEATADVTGFVNVKEIDARDWIEYNIDVPEPATYYISLRVASTQNTSISIFADNEQTANVPFDNTGGWQNWKTVTAEMMLEAGKHTLRIKPGTGGFNFNWIDFNTELVLGSQEETSLPVLAYPNPMLDKLYIRNHDLIESVEIFDLLGRNVLNQDPEAWIDCTDLTQGSYLIKFVFPSGKRELQKIIKY